MPGAPRRKTLAAPTAPGSAPGAPGANATPCPASPDVLAFLAAERRRGLSVNTVVLRRAAVRYPHFLAGCPVPTAEAQVAETMSGIRREAADPGETAAKKLAATVAILREILRPIPEDPRGLRDRALLLVASAGALRRSELAAVCVQHLETRERGLRLTLPRSKGERDGRPVTVAIRYGSSELCPVRALRRWQDAAGITDGPCSTASGCPLPGASARAPSPPPWSASTPSILAPSPYRPTPRRRRRVQSRGALRP